MRSLPYTLTLLFGLALHHPPVLCAAGNPVLDALAQGSVVQLSGKEAVSEPFAFDVTIATADKALNVSSAVGQPFAVALLPGRTASGMIESVEQVDHAASQGLYRIRLVSPLQRLHYRSTSRSFYNMNAIQIATAVMNEAGITNVEVRVGATLPARELTVQYRETDQAFVSRLLEEAGIHYHVESASGGDKLVLSDGNAGFAAAAGVKFNSAPGAGPAVVSFTRGQSLHSGQVQAGDYNWKTPTIDLSAVAQAVLFGDLSERQFPAGIETKAEAQAQAAIRLAAHIAESQVCRGESTIPQLQAGQRVALLGHPRADFNQEYVITAVEHQRTAKEYRNAFRCLPAQVPYRPSLATPRPVVGGVVSGIVVGPPGETKHVDQFGRVKVRFPWRSPVHSNQNDPGDSGFVRVAQIAAGSGSAALWLPEVGDEVLVAFEHGDPDRPVVVGSVYNGKDLPPVALPAGKHVSLFRTQAPNGPKAETVYDSTPGSERLVVMTGQNALTAGSSGIALQGSAVALASSGDLSVKSAQNVSLTAQKDAMVSVGGNMLINNTGTLRSTVGGDAQFTVGSNLQTTVGVSTVLEQGKDLTIRTGQQFLLQSARTARLTAGEDALIQTGKAFVVNANTMMQFVAAQTGTIQAAKGLLIKSDGDIDILGRDIDAKASGNLTLKGSKITQN